MMSDTWMEHLMEKEASEQLLFNPAPVCDNVLASDIHEDSKNCIPSEDGILGGHSNNTMSDITPDRSSRTLTERGSQFYTPQTSPSTSFSNDGNSLELEADDSKQILDNNKHIARQPSNELLFLKPVSPENPEALSSLADKDSPKNADENAADENDVDMKLGDTLNLVTDRSKLKPLKDRIAK